MWKPAWLLPCSRAGQPDEDRRYDGNQRWFSICLACKGFSMLPREHERVTTDSSLHWALMTGQWHPDCKTTLIQTRAVLLEQAHATILILC